ncbi:MAG: replicative DNA helicase [Bacteriovoracaceae bacterium]|jgi:replicative DNA helicase|nr:replicative DNA helicase [Bacteriovoracaceae bacterium]
MENHSAPCVILENVREFPLAVTLSKRLRSCLKLQKEMTPMAMHPTNEMPHDLLAEKALIGCLIIDGEVFDQISNLKIRAEHFYDPRHAIIFDVVQDLFMANKPIDYVTVSSKLQERGKLEEIGGQAFLLLLVEDQATVANSYEYAKIVKEKASMREILRTAQRVLQNGMSYSGNTDDFIQEVEASFFKLTNDAKTGGMVKLNSCLKHNLKDLEDTSRGRGEISGLPTGYNKLDELLLGMQAGQLIILGARPAMGKSALALNVAMNVCVNTGLPIAIFSLEMLANELSMRLLSGKAKVDSKRIRKKDFLDTDLRSIAKAVQELSTLPIYINDSGACTILDIQSQCRKIKADQGLGLIVIDYLQLMQSTNKMLSREQQISEISRGLKTLAKELECPIIALSQLNRSVETRVDKRPTMADIRESGAIEQDADIVMFIYRDEYYNKESTKEPGVAEVIVGKNRGGETGTAKLAFVGAYTSFENLAFRD